MTELPGPDGTRFGPIGVVERTGSTNADLLAEASNGAPEGRVLVTGHQTAGRGRQRRTWHDEPGNALLVSILLRPEATRAPLLPLVAGLAAVEAVGELAGTGAGRSPVGLKWPNDVLAPGHGERKLAGILAEAASHPGDDRLVVVVGMGLNLRWGSPPPPEIAERAVTLEEVLGAPAGREVVLDAFLRSLERHLRILEGPDGPDSGPAATMTAYRARCLTIGRRVRFATGAGEYRGTAVDVTPSGRLVLDLGEGERIELDAGDAHHLGAADPPGPSGMAPRA